MPDDASMRSADASGPRASSALGAATFLSRGFSWGLVAGAAIGGVCGRLAMLLLRLTSDGSLRGVKTDDDFVIGRFSTETIFLVVLAALLGAVGGLLYLLVREWIPRNWRAAVFGALCATTVGSAVISPGGVDFTALSPMWLAVAMFVLIPAAYGVAESVLVERSIRLGHVPEGRRRWLVMLPFGVLLIAPPIALVSAVVFFAVRYANRSGRMAQIWRSNTTIWVGRSAVTVLFLASTNALVRDVSEVL
jgi:hypothetical protein